MAEDCKDCTDRTPVLPQYSKANPVVNPNCITCGDDGIYVPPSTGEGRTTELIEGTDIDIQDISDSNTDRFIISYDPTIQLAANLRVVGRVAGIEVPDVGEQYILYGVVVDRAELTWFYNRPDVVIQTITNNYGLLPPVLGSDDRQYIYEPTTIANTARFILTGNDNQGTPQSQAVASASLTFGNYRCWGVGARRDLGVSPATEMKSFLEALIGGLGTKELEITRVKASLIGEGLTENDFMYYFFPKDWEFATFLQYGAPGGWVRLGNLGGLMQKVPMDSFEPGEIDLSINNGTASEPYLVYQSYAGAIEGVDIEVR